MPIKINEATSKQLREFAQRRYGLKLSNFLKREMVIERLREVHDGDTLDEVSPVAAAESAKPVAAAPRVEPRARILLPRTSAKDGNEPLFVRVNGVGYLIPRGEPCEVPERYMRALENSVATVYDQTFDPSTSSFVTTSREVPAHPFQLLAYPV